MQVTRGSKMLKAVGMTSLAFVLSQPQLLCSFVVARSRKSRRQGAPPYGGSETSFVVHRVHKGRGGAGRTQTSSPTLAMFRHESVCVGGRSTGYFYRSPQSTM